MKTKQIFHSDSREDSGLKMIKFRKGIFKEVIARDVSFLMSLTSLNLEL